MSDQAEANRVRFGSKADMTFRCDECRERWPACHKFGGLLGTNHACCSIHCNDRKQLNTTHRIQILSPNWPDFSRMKRPVSAVGG